MDRPQSLPLPWRPATPQPNPIRAKPLKIISPFSAGSPPDALGRLVAQQLTVSLGQSVVVENRPGAGTTIGTKAGAMADPDGYTLVQVNAALSYGPVLYPNPGYDPLKSFAPVASLASWTHVLVAHPSVAANSLQELIAYAKANPGQLNIGSPLGNPPHVLAEMLKMNTGADFNSVPYRQTPQLVTDLLAGRIQLYFAAGEPMISMIKQGKLKAYAFTGYKARCGVSGCPDHGRGRIAATHVQCERLDRPAGAGWNPRRPDRQAQCNHQRQSQVGGDQGQPGQARLGGEDRHTG